MPNGQYYDFCYSQNMIEPPETFKPSSFTETFMPDNSTVESQLSIRSQRIRINYSELEQHLSKAEELKTGNNLELVRQLADLTVEVVKEGDAKWEEIVSSGQDEKYTLSRCISENANSCFQRSVFFNLLMQRVKIPVATLEGTWVESKRPDLTEAPEDPMFIKPGGYRVSQSDASEAHLWNVVRIGNRYVIVDTSNLVSGKPLIEDVDPKSDQKYFKFTLPSGKTRHYIADGTVNVFP